MTCRKIKLSADTLFSIVVGWQVVDLVLVLQKVHVAAKLGQTVKQLQVPTVTLTMVFAFSDVIMVYLLVSLVRDAWRAWGALRAAMGVGVASKPLSIGKTEKGKVHQCTRSISSDVEELYMLPGPRHKV